MQAMTKIPIAATTEVDEKEELFSKASTIQ